MEMYKKRIGIDFEMPIFSALDWEKICNNVCVISFIQGLTVGTTTYNNYCILPSTENEQYVSEKNIYYIGYDKVKNADGRISYEPADGSYHRLGCKHLQGDLIVRI